jgi:hypothetical protein
MTKKLYNLFLDDVRFPKTTFEYTKNPIYLNEEWEIVRSYKEFVKIITERGTPYMVSFDHDLADAHYNPLMYQNGKLYMQYVETTGEKTGYDCVKWLVDYCIDAKCEFPMWYIHSMNPVGSEYMRDYIKSYLRSIETAASIEEEEKSYNGQISEYLKSDDDPFSRCACGGQCRCQQ